MITQFKLFESNNKKEIVYWLKFYKPDSDNTKDLISRIKSILKTSNTEMTISDFDKFDIDSPDKDPDFLYNYNEMFENGVVIFMYDKNDQEFIDSYNLEYEDLSDSDIEILYNFLIERIEEKEIYYSLIMFANEVYGYTESYREREYLKVKPLFEILDCYYI